MSTHPNAFTIYRLPDGSEYIYCPIRQKAYKVDQKPEEKVRQEWLYRLKEVYNYSFDQISVEVSVKVGSTEAKKKADIVVYTDSKKATPRIFIEVKKPKRKDGIDQLKVYMNATGCRLGLWSNGTPPHVYLLRTEPKPGEEEAEWRELRNIPSRTEKLADVDTPLTRKELEPVTDFLSILKECEDYIKAHEGGNPFEEVFKLIFAKLYDEKNNLKKDDSSAQFRVGALESPVDARARIDDLFARAREKWSGVFHASEKLQLTDTSVAFCVSALQKSYLLKSDTDVLGSAFEVMINPTMKGDKGQYFTPRHVIRMCIEVLDPKEDEFIFDPACGSGGFLIAAMDHVFKTISNERDDNSEVIEHQKDYASEKVYGADYDQIIAKVAKAYMLIWGDGRSNVVVCDTLNEDTWNADVAAKLSTGEGKANKLRQFDIIVTNPPFGGDIDTDTTLNKYEVAFKPTQNGRKRQNKVSRDKLFLERCIAMLKPGGRMAIVIPRGLTKNYTDEYIRRFIMTHTKILAVVGLSGRMFKPFTNTKTCILFLEKRKKPLRQIKDQQRDPETVYAVTEKPGKDRSGNLVYVSGTRQVDSDLNEITEFLKKNITYSA